VPRSYIYRETHVLFVCYYKPLAFCTCQSLTDANDLERLKHEITKRKIIKQLTNGGRGAGITTLDTDTGTGN
jgi:hypothetical protein